jgi:DNA-binding LacI/PurR family transcriptional regulator
MANAVKTKRVTLKAVAEAAGVSLPTASQILNNKANNYCSEEKKRLVRQVARKLNYQPNFGYKVMCGHKTNTVGVICSKVDLFLEEHIKDLLLTLMTKFETLGYSVYSSVLSGSDKANVDRLSSLINRGCSAFVFLGAPVGEEKIEDICLANNIPYVFYSTYSYKRNITIDSSYAIRCFIEDFMKEGRENFKLMTNINSEYQDSRLSGLLDYFPNTPEASLIEKYVLPLNYHEFNEVETIFKMGYEKTGELLEKDPDIRGIIYRNDRFALGGAKYLFEHGYKIGEDIKICGYNNSEAVRLAPWPINTADHDVESLCSRITENLFKAEPFNIVLKPKVILK